MITKSSFGGICLFFIILLLQIVSKAEGTRQVAPNSSILIDGTATSDIAALLINHPEYNRFATYNNNDPNSRLYIHIADPTMECIFLGFSVGHANQSSPTPTLLSYEYRVRDPNGNVVFGPITVTPGDENITSWTQAYTGPNVLFGNDGYNALDISSSDLMSAGWSGAGDFYIEFQNTSNAGELLIDYWDITVSTCIGAPDIPKPGRIWSYNWAFFAINDFGFPVRPFNGSFHVCAPDPDDAVSAFITKIDFNNSGFRPAAFNVAFNSFGIQNTGNINLDRQSVESINATNPEYAIFLNDPIDLCQTAIAGEIALEGISRCDAENYCIQIIATKEGQINLLLDFDGNDNIYTPGSADVLISQTLTASDVNQETCLDWDGLDGFGMPMDENISTVIPVTIAFAQGIYHFPIYDAELMSNGFTITNIRPAGSTSLLYYDDVQITVPSGSGEPKTQLNGCPMPCHRWTNYTAATTIGYGNLNTINSWWFSQLVIEQEIFLLPTYLTCEIIGPDTICGDEQEVLQLELLALPNGVVNPDVISQIWSGPGIIRSVTGDQITIDQGGDYNVDITWINGLGDTCRTNCMKTVEALEMCCSLEMTCQLQSDSYDCETGVPPPLEGVDELIDAGLLVVRDIECSHLLMTITTSEENTGCPGDPKETIYSYEIWDDSNGNGLPDSNEVIVSCEQHYLTIDSVQPTIDFTSNLAGYTSGDTILLNCMAADPDWSIPMPTLDDVLAIDMCNEISLDLIDLIEQASDCRLDGFLKFYTCIWQVTDDCGNSAEIVLYMKLIDETAPIITRFPTDMTITCDDEIPLPSASAEDECNCAELDIVLDTLVWLCTSDFVLSRRYAWTDHCGNQAIAIQLITIRDDSGIEMELPNEWTEGINIEVPCTNGTLPAWVAEITAGDVKAYSSCEDVVVTYTLEQIDGSNCNGYDYVSKFQLAWAASDACGRSADRSVFVTVIDEEPPKILSYPPIACDGSFDPASIVVVDNCGINDIMASKVNIQTDCANTQKFIYLWEIYDNCGNVTFGEQTIYEGDVNPPLILLSPPHTHLQSGDTLHLECSQNQLPTILSQDLLGAIDDCSEVDIVYTETRMASMDCTLNQLGLYLGVWTATDACGNEADFELFIKVETPDLRNLIPDLVISQSCGDAIPVPDIDVCIDHLEKVDELIAPSCSGQLSFVAYEIHGLCGERIADTMWLQLSDTNPPEFNDIPQTICASDDPPVAFAWDHCEQRLIPVSIIETREQVCGLPLITIIYSATDNCGNEARHAVTIVPENLEIDFELFYKNQRIYPIGTIPFIFIEPCPFNLDLNDFHVEPDCPLIQFEVDLELNPDINCLNSDYVESRDYQVNLISDCGRIGNTQFTVNITDDQAPLFINPPADVTISCFDTLRFPNLEYWDNCGEVIIEKEEVVLPGLPGSISYLQIWIATDQCGNSTQHERILTQFMEPLCQIIAPSEVPCNSLQTLAGDVIGGFGQLSYRWTVLQGNCEIVTENHNQEIIDVIVFGDSVFIELTVTDEFGCASSCLQLMTCTDKPTSPGSSRFAHGDLKPQTFFYPNPINETLNIRADEHIHKVRIYDIQGRQILDKLTQSTSVSLDLRSLDSGIFLVLVEMIDGRIDIQKMVKM